MSPFALIPSAYAQAAGQPAGAADLIQSFAPFVIIIGIFYFLMFRPQQQKAKQLKNQLAQLRRGDSVITAGGIIGTVARLVGDNELVLEIAEGVRVRVIRSTITGIASKSEAPTDSSKDIGENEAEKAPVKDGEKASARTQRRRKIVEATPVPEGNNAS